MQVNKTKLCDVFGFSAKTFTEWQRDETFPIIEKGGKGKQNKYSTVQVFNWIRANDKKKNVTELEIERTRLTKLQADRQDEELRLIKGETVKRDDIMAEFSKVIIEIKSQVLTVPNRAATMLQGVDDIIESKHILENIIAEVLQNIGTNKKQDNKRSSKKHKATAKSDSK